MAYSGGWRRWVANASGQPVRLEPPIDAQHLDPADNTMPVHWEQDTAQYPLPDELVGGQYIQPPVAGGPLDYTPVSHDVGSGVRPGDSPRQAQIVRGIDHEQDYGAVQARRYAPADSRDGAWHVDIIDDTRNGGASPRQLDRKVTGIEGSDDAYARTGRRIWRWRDRFIDRHMWGVDFRPALIRNAYTAPQSGPQSNGDQYTSPAPLMTSGGTDGIGTGDKFRLAQVRRVPRPWDEELATDGTAYQSTTTDGLTVWGL